MADRVSVGSAAGEGCGAPPQGAREHIVLVGLMGSGKTTVGRRVAARLGRPFVDADEALAEHHGRTVRQVFEEDGEPVFRAMESAVLAELLARADPTVIAAGGGVVVPAENRELLSRPDVFVVWLRAGAAFLATRTAKKEGRPLLDGDPETVLARLAAERQGFYEEVADVVVDVEPVHEAEPKPKAVLAWQVVALVRAREGLTE
ncbi:MAG: shikimate kinase [Acidimicrobiia bacterium]